MQTGASSEIVVKTANEDHEVTGEGTLDIEVTLSKQSPALKMGASAVLRIFFARIDVVHKKFQNWRWASDWYLRLCHSA